MTLRLYCLAVAAAALALAAPPPPARTPPMGFNSWTSLNSRVDAASLMAVAQAMHDNGMLAAGYEYVNSDDEWMERDRSASGQQVPNPVKFPQGWPPVTAFIHSLGMKAGLYTSKSQWTCAGFNASCEKEVVDAASYASWGIDYVKEDSCGGCRGNDTLDYATMWAAIQAAGRPMVLTTEGNPDNAACSAVGGCGNAKRVGHDVGNAWNNVQSLVDIGAGLWPFAHNATTANPTVGGWWNDLDMMQMGNGGDFACGADAAALARCRAHFSLWCIMKAPLLTGADPRSFDVATLAVLTNTEAVAINQDALGVQARRVAVANPANTSLTGAAGGWDNIAVARRCDSASPTQRWRWTNSSRPGPASQLYQQPCDVANAAQNWTLGADGTVRSGASSSSGGSAQCVVAGTGGCLAALAVAPCNASAPGQRWALLPGGQVVSNATGQCWDIPYGTGPQVALCSCHPPGTATNQEWTQAAPGAALVSLAAPDSCVGLAAGPTGGVLSTVDAAGAAWCLRDAGGCEGGWVGVPCDGPAAPPTALVPLPHGPAPPGPANYSLQQPGASGPGWNNQPGASGPWPHTRYVTGSEGTWTLDLDAAQTPAGTAVVAADRLGILDDDLVGGVTHGGDFCLDLATGGMLETWAGQLSSGRLAVALFNRSPAEDSLTAAWGALGLPADAPYAVRDVWAAADRGTFTGAYTAAGVPARAAVLLVLSPA